MKKHFPSKGKALIIIPARMGSKRFPGKVLKNLGKLPVFEWCRRAALRAACGPVVVATDHPRVIQAVKRYGGAAVKTPANCRSGTDRVYAATRMLERKHKRRYSIVINLQGDEPFIAAATIRKVAKRLANGSGADIVTAVTSLKDQSSLLDSNVVKVALSQNGRCLYFSRSPIPYFRKSADAKHSFARYRHIGIYGFKRRALERFVHLPPSQLERSESLEQLRALEAGLSIAAVRAREKTMAIDTPADLIRAERHLQGQGDAGGPK